MIFIDTATLSLNGGAKPVEVYVPLWFANGTNTPSNATGATVSLIRDGSTAPVTPSDNTARIFKLSSTFDASTQFALEVTMWISAANGSVSSAQLYDFNTATVVASTLVTTTSMTANIVRSSKFSLTPGHTYGVTSWSGNGSTNACITDASLIIFP